MATFARRTKEPNWGYPSDCIDAAQRLNLSNLGTLQGAIGSTILPVADIFVTRNYFAHRNMDTATKLKNSSFFVSGTLLQMEQLTGAHVSLGITRMHSWIVSLRIVAEAAIQ
jgi:hypothetical protein